MTTEQSVVIVKTHLGDMDSCGHNARHEQTNRSEEIVFEMYPLRFDRAEDGFILQEIDQLIVVERPRVKVHLRFVRSHDTTQRERLKEQIHRLDREKREENLTDRFRLGAGR